MVNFSEKKTKKKRGKICEIQKFFVFLQRKTKTKIMDKDELFKEKRKVTFVSGKNDKKKIHTYLPMTKKLKEEFEVEKKRIGFGDCGAVFEGWI